ncbi:MAG: hypothetical protein IKE63_02755 [Bacilli bacterium]|nr:hypothetical protein [Bacilli bacterium]
MINNIPLLLSGVFYSILFIFSIATGMLYMLGIRKLNPIELSDEFVETLDTEEKVIDFAKKMGLVTFIVGIVQGITAYAILNANSKVFFIIALGFTIISIASVLFKLKGKINAFPIVKLVFYVMILITLLFNFSYF